MLLYYGLLAFKVKAIEVHHLRPGFAKVLDELITTIFRGIHLSDGAEGVQNFV